MTKLNLTAHQHAELIKLERESFREHCEILGGSTDHCERLLLTIAKRELADILNSRVRRDTVLPTDFRSTMDMLLNAPNWWSYKEIQKRMYVEDAVRCISQLSTVLPIDWSYTRTVAQEFDMEPPSSDYPESVGAFVRELPHVLLYGFEFNAYAARDARLGHLPAVFIFEHLISAAEAFLAVVLSQMLTVMPSGRVGVLAATSWDQVGTDPLFVRQCQHAIEMALCRRAYLVHEPDLHISRFEPALQTSCYLALHGATEFVRMHEYGHLLMGHLLKSPAHSREFEADAFAIKVLHLKRQEVHGAPFWLLLGAVAVLLLLAIIEKVNGVEASVTHPPAEQRLAAVLASDDDPKRLLSLYTSTIIGICNSTLHQYWAIQVGMPDDGVRFGGA